MYAHIPMLESSLLKWLNVNNSMYFLLTCLLNHAFQTIVNKNTYSPPPNAVWASFYATNKNVVYVNFRIDDHIEYPTYCKKESTALKLLPSILDMLELCMSGHALSIFLRSSLAQTMKAFIGRLMCGLLSLSLFCWRTIFATKHIQTTVKPWNLRYPVREVSFVS